MVIAVVCLNPALDVTYHVDELVHGSSHLVTAQRERAGGKGVNVARVLHQLGTPTQLLGLLGGRRGDLIAQELRAAGLPARWTPIRGEARQTVAVVDSDATVLLEPGPYCSPVEWEAFEADFVAALDGGVELVVLSGSLPPGVPLEAYGDLVRLAAKRSVRTVVDAGGTPLHAGLAAQPYLAKPNAVEAADVLAVDPQADVLDLARAVVGSGAVNAVVSDGSAGLIAVVDSTAYHVQGPVIEGGNPTGAGDALTAALARGIVTGQEWPAALRDAAAIAAGAAALPYAGGFDPDVASEVAPLVAVRELPS